MKIAVSSSTGKPDQEFSPRFGRCEYFLIVEEGTDEWDRILNPAVSAQGGAGTQVVQDLASRGVEAVISGRYGPNAYDALDAAGIDAYLAKSGTPRQLVGQVRAGSLRLAACPSGAGLHGAARGNGTGKGLGRGRR